MDQIIEIVSILESVILDREKEIESRYGLSLGYDVFDPSHRAIMDEVGQEKELLRVFLDHLENGELSGLVLRMYVGREILTQGSAISEGDIKSELYESGFDFSNEACVNKLMEKFGSLESYLKS